MKIKEYTAEDWLRIGKNTGLTVLGTLVLAFGSAIFLLPFHLVTGGMTGLSIVLDALIPLPFLTAERLLTFFTWGLFLLGALLLGKPFAAKTLISAIVYPVGIALFSRFVDEDVLNGFFDLRGAGYGALSILLAALFGGVLVGAGCALTFLGGGSTGGTDIIAFLICRLLPRAKSPNVIFAVDAAIILSGVFVTRDLAVTLLGIISAFVASAVIDRIFLGGAGALIAEIVTEEHEPINRAVIEKLGRTTTILDVTGGYTGKGKKMISVCFAMREYADILAIVNRYDRRAFMTVHRAHEVSGEGWTTN
ncbi:MAG: YitT family protein [Clostridia bacterium]|nr:YitT family protein [Clostridia bacterium]